MRLLKLLPMTLAIHLTARCQIHIHYQSYPNTVFYILSPSITEYSQWLAVFVRLQRT